MQAAYFPIYVNTLYEEHQHIQMLAYVYLSPPLGVILGYILGAVVIDFTEWQVAFMLIAGINLINTVLMILFPGQYINTTDIIKQMKEVQEDRLRQNFGINSEVTSNLIRDRNRNLQLNQQK